jgi:hypothetical protein
LNSKKFNGKGTYIGAFNKYWWDNHERAIGHVAVEHGGKYYDASGKISLGELESWGMLDEEDPDYQHPDMKEEDYYEVKFVKLSEKQVSALFDRCDINEELIGTSGGVRYFQMGGSLPKKLYNKKDGKGTKEVGSAKFRGEKGTSSSKDIESDLKKKKRWYTKESKEDSLPANYFEPGDSILFGKYKNKKGTIKGFGKDEKDNPTIKIKPTPNKDTGKKKKDQEIGLYKIWKQQDLKEDTTPEIDKEIFIDIDNPELSQGKKYHITQTSVRDILSTEQDKSNVRLSGKPNGFWYSCGDDWLRFLKSEMPDKLKYRLYVYEVEIDMPKILSLKDGIDLDVFTEKYKDNYSKFGKIIDWRKVSEEYSGIEICPYVGSRRMKLTWYYGWDVASGCIWDKSAIKSLKLVSVVKRKSEMQKEAYYHGTTTHLLPGDDVLPPLKTGKISERGRKKNLDKVFFTKDLGSAKIYAGRAKHALGGKPVVYEVEPVGDIQAINDKQGTTVFMANKAKVVKKI